MESIIEEEELESEPRVPDVIIEDLLQKFNSIQKETLRTTPHLKLI